MAARPVRVDPTQYTTADDSAMGKVAANLANINRSEIGKQFIEHKLEEYFSPFSGLIEVEYSNKWLSDYIDIEDGDSSATWDIDEFAAGNLAMPTLGYETTNEAVLVNSNAMFSIKETIRKSKEGDNLFKQFVAEKYAKAMRDIILAVRRRFRTEVLNKAADPTAPYLFADGQPLLSDSHAYRNTTAFDNFVQVGGSPTPLNEAALDALRELEATLTDSSGEPLEDFAYDTLIVAAGSANEKEAFKLAGVGDALVAVKNAVSENQAGRITLSPVTVGDINVYQGTTLRVISVKQMDANLWLAVDSKKPAPFVLRVVERPFQGKEVPGVNGTVLYPFYTAMNFWAKRLPVYVAGSKV